MVGLPQLVAALPDRRLEQLMGTPARRPVVEAIFLLMPLYVNRARLRGVSMTVRWQVSDVGSFDLIIADQRCRVLRGDHDRAPLVTIALSPADLLRLAIGRLNPIQAYFAGRVKLRGDVMQATRLTSLFRIPTAASKPRRNG